MQFVRDFLDEGGWEFSIIGSYCNKFDGPFAHGEALASGREVFEDLL